MVPSVVSINIGKYNICHRPDEAMLFIMVKVTLHLINILLFRTLKDSFFLKMYLNRMRNLHQHKDRILNERCQYNTRNSPNIRHYVCSVYSVPGHYDQHCHVVIYQLQDFEHSLGWMCHNNKLQTHIQCKHFWRCHSKSVLYAWNRKQFHLHTWVL